MKVAATASLARLHKGWGQPTPAEEYIARKYFTELMTKWPKSKEAQKAKSDLFEMDNYPQIDVASGGSITGVVSGLNRIVDLAFAEFRTEGGTLVVPGHGRLADLGDVTYYRDMVTIIRDRVQDMIGRQLSLADVKKARPTLDWDPRFGVANGDTFVEAVYKTLAPPAAPGRRPSGRTD
jgi:hypothetical protein